ncbi:MAG TPA: hypothetical protein VKU38_07915 [Ktedonobacteraceae bacterium]|nr:hypothetical protein [Ktedonobacteraceae bacterium]
MNHALRYEGQQQRFESREQQSSAMKHRYFHLHLHLRLNMHMRHSSQTTVARLTRIFAAFMLAFSMALSFAILTFNGYTFIGPRINLALNALTIGSLVGLGAVLIGGIPLMIAAYRSSPRSRFLFALPCYTLAFALTIVLFLVEMSHRTTNAAGPFALPLWALFFYGMPIISTIAINRGIRQAILPDKWLRFATILGRVVILGIVLMIGGMILWGATVAIFLPQVFPQLLSLLTIPWNSWLLQLIGMLIALVVAVHALFSQVSASHKPRPHDESPSDGPSFYERGYRPVNPD